MGHKPDQRARKKRRERVAKKGVFVDEVRTAAKKAPAEERLAERKAVDEFVETSHQACRARISDAKRVSGTLRVDVGNPPILYLEDSAYRKLASRLRKDGLKVAYSKKQVRSNMETWRAGAIFTLTW